MDIEATDGQAPASEETAVIEMAAAAGLVLAAESERDPRHERDYHITRAVPDTLIELPATGEKSARNRERMPMSSPCTTSAGSASASGGAVSRTAMMSETRTSAVSVMPAKAGISGRVGAIWS